MLELMQRIYLIFKAEALGKCMPNGYIASVHDIDGKWLERNRIKCVLFDADNTLFPHHAKKADAQVLGMLRRLSKKYRLGIASNVPTPERAGELERYFKSKGVKILVSRGKGKKPMPGQFAYLAEKFNAKPGQCVMVGDNLFTDVAGARLFGMRALKVEAYDWKSEPAYFMVMRFFEKVLE